MFPSEYINYGKIVFTGCTVSVFKNYYDSRYLPNIPGGRIVNAYWQGNNVIVLMDSGMHYVYNDFSNYTSYWR